MKFEIPIKMEVYINYVMEAETKEEAFQKVKVELEKLADGLKFDGVCDSIKIQLTDDAKD